MDRIYKLMKEKKALEQQKQDLELLIKEKNLQICSNGTDIAQAYKNFYDKKIYKKFVLYNRYPSIESLKVYLQQFSSFPLYDFGVLNVKELAEIIKHAYQFKTGKNFEILTIGATEQYGPHIRDFHDGNFSFRPHLYFLVGNDQSLRSFKEYNGMFSNSDKLYRYISSYAHGRNLISIEIDRDDKNSLGIECLTGKIFDKKGSINYWDPQGILNDTFGASINKQIFLDFYYDEKIKGIKDVLDFNVHLFDTYIAKILISIIIYKRNNHIQQLTEEDYNHIFDVLFGEKVSILEDVKKDIPRKLTYVHVKREKSFSAFD